MPVYNRLPQASGGTETLLWTNGSPTTGASSFTCNLSESATNFKKLKFVYRTFSSATFTAEVEYLIDNGKHQYFVDTANYPRFALTGKGASYAYIRIGYFSDTTNWQTIKFENSLRQNTSGNLNTSMLPLYIYGIK